MNIATTIDTAPDRTIALGYGHIGLELRRRLPGWPADAPRMDGQVVLRRDHQQRGTMPRERQRSADGHELMFATHVLAPFALTRLVEELLSRSRLASDQHQLGGMYAQRAAGLPPDDAADHPHRRAGR